MKIEADFEIMVKVLVIGDYAVGKTNLICRFIDNYFNDNHISTTGFDYKEKLMTLPTSKKTIKMQVWDTAGQERYRSLNKNLYTKVQGIILIYDITQRDTFDNVEEWVMNIKDQTSKIPVLLVGNKTDLEEDRTISTEEGKELGEKMKVNFYEVSAKEDMNVKEAFIDIAETILSNAERGRRGTFILNKDKKDKKICCNAST